MSRPPTNALTTNSLSCFIDGPFLRGRVGIGARRYHIRLTSPRTNPGAKYVRSNRPRQRVDIRRARQPVTRRTELDQIRDCSRATGFIQLVPDEVLQEFVDGLRLELPATYPARDAP